MDQSLAIRRQPEVLLLTFRLCGGQEKRLRAPLPFLLSDVAVLEVVGEQGPHGAPDFLSPGTHRLFVVLLAQLTAGLDALQDVLAVLVELELLDDDLAGVDAQGHALAGSLVAGDTLDVDLVLETVDRGDLALTALVGAADNLDLVILADGDAADLEEGGFGVSTGTFLFSSGATKKEE